MPIYCRQIYIFWMNYMKLYIRQIIAFFTSFIKISSIYRERKKCDFNLFFEKSHLLERHRGIHGHCLTQTLLAINVIISSKFRRWIIFFSPSFFLHFDLSNQKKTNLLFSHAFEYICSWIIFQLVLDQNLVFIFKNEILSHKLNINWIHVHESHKKNLWMRAKCAEQVRFKQVTNI